MYKKPVSTLPLGSAPSPPSSPQMAPVSPRRPSSPTSSPPRAASAPGPASVTAHVTSAPSILAPTSGAAASSSSASIRKVTLRIAQKDIKHADVATKTFTADDIMGFTQKTRDQLPTVYFGAWHSGQQNLNGRATQVHRRIDNVGVHPPKPTVFFGNIPESLLDSVRDEKGKLTRDGVIRAVELFMAGGQTTETGPTRLVELHSKEGKISGKHVSRSSFQPATTPGQRETLFHMLENGPLNVAKPPSEEA